MKKILLSALLLMTLINAKDVNLILINDGTKPKIDLMAEIMKLDAKEKLLDKKIKEQNKDLVSTIELGKALDELTNTLLIKQKK